jgi:outer membrane lipoprotein SlyB
METQSSKSPHPMVWVAAIAVVVFCGAGAAAFLGWIPSSMSTPAEEARLAKLEAAKPSPAHSSAPKVHSAQAPVVVAARCSECGVVQSVREVDAKGEGSGIGVVGGAVAGGVLGHQVGKGDGNTVATVIGAVGGAVAGNEIEKRVKSTKSFEITVRFEDGSTRVITEANATSWRSGDKVRVVNGVIQSNA